ncbi:dihydrodipicolinate synthase family protein [Desulfofalx alkaliphila]|uniref:dihydrodipicolinate synthase family protein n=1 Tax=Desulfofalx alkaliphila TaxID=105483 RepID=UPI0004E1EEDB|nr:dihydrodipicolinate synthase family protein [Desulfofalx alkaliphila]
MFRPEGIYVAMLTPFKEGKVNETVLRQVVEFQIQRGVHGLFPVSSCGEFIQMDFAEKIRTMEIVVDQAAGRVPVTPGVTAPNPNESIALAKEAKRAGCSGVVICPPYFLPISQETIERHFELLADNVDIPVILYNIPAFTTPITYDVVKRLSRRENIVAMKDSSGSVVDMVHFMDKVRAIGMQDKFNFLIGREDGLFPALMMGGKGCMTACAGIVPEILVGIWDSYHKGEFEKAKELQFSFLNLLRAMNALPFPVGFKLALELRGFEMGEPMQPLSHAEKYNYVNVRSRLEKIMGALLGDYKVDLDQLMKK